MVHDAKQNALTGCSFGSQGCACSVALGSRDWGMLAGVAWGDALRPSSRLMVLGARSGAGAIACTVNVLLEQAGERHAVFRLELLVTPG